jgi:hypothetical protein
MTGLKLGGGEVTFLFGSAFFRPDPPFFFSSACGARNDAGRGWGDEFSSWHRLSTSSPSSVREMYSSSASVKENSVPWESIEIEFSLASIPLPSGCTGGGPPTAVSTIIDRVLFEKKFENSTTPIRKPLLL